MNDTSGLILLLVTIGILVVGYIGLTVAEILRIKQTNWVDEKQSVSYPIVTNLINIPVAVLCYMITMTVIMFAAYFGLMAVLFNVGDNPTLVTITMIAYWLLSAVFMFIIYLAAFSLVRLIMTKVLVKFSTLTWKYIVGQSALLAALPTIAYLILTIIGYLITMNSVSPVK